MVYVEENRNRTNTYGSPPSEEIYSLRRKCFSPVMKYSVDLLRHTNVFLRITKLRSATDIQRIQIKSKINE
jgi:hypothetical protein